MDDEAIAKESFRFLFQHRLLTAQNDLASFLKALNEGECAFLQPAFSTRALAGLIESLAGILDQFAAPAVLEDLQRLSASGVLYRASFDGPSMTAKKITEAFAPDEPIPFVAAAPHKVAYERYMKWILGRDRKAPEARKRQTSDSYDYYVGAFFRRHPVAWYVMDLVCRHFLSNIKEGCRRIFADRGALQRVFFQNQELVCLDRITSTGSDFHKEGHQVLIVDLCMAGAGGLTTKKLVYKPSDVEIDYALVGRNAALQAFLQGMPAEGYPVYTESLAERLNRLCRPANEALAGRLWGEPRSADRVGQVELATYLILPRNPGSRLQEENGRLPIERSYGYVEFLTHEPTLTDPFPRLDVDAVVARELNRSFPPDRTYDWIAADPRVGYALAYQWGQLMVLALLAGTSDVHVQNQLVHGLKPHIIDLEESFKPPAGFRSSYIAMHFARADDPGHKVAVYNLETRATQAVPLWIGEEPTPGYSKNQLYVRANANEIYRAAPDRNLQFVLDGIQAAAQAVRAERARADLSEWLAARSELVVRHVPQTTGIFADALRQNYEDLLKSDGTDALTPPITNEKVAARLQALRVEAAQGKLKSWVSTNPPPPPYFLLEELENNNLRDYENFDIPYYVRRVREQQIRNSAGRPVGLANAWNELGSPSLAPRTLPSQYFQDPMPDTLVNRLQTWGGSDEDFIKEMTRLIREAFPTAGGDAFTFLGRLLDPQPVRAPPT